MAAITFASKLKDDRSFTIPEEAVESLGLQSGDEIQVRIEAASGRAEDQAYFNQVIAQLLEEAEGDTPVPGEPTSNPHEAAFVEALREKYRKQGFDL